MTEPCERRTSHRAPGLLLASALLLVALPLPAVAEEFDVLVLRGSTVSRVTGDENGPLSEVTVREDPHPPAPVVREETTGSEPEVVIRIGQEESYQDWGTTWYYPWRHNVLPLPPMRPAPYYDRSSRPGHGPLRPRGVAPPRSVLSGGPRGLRSSRR